MAKFVKTKAHEAIEKYREVSTFEQAIFQFVSVLKGKIKSITWFKNKKGVAETTIIKYEDDSELKVTKFIKSDNTVRTSVKVV